jgi:glucose-1-phosphate cytidylyltransferase
MKLVILAGGQGTRISEESVIKPKPLIEIGQMPIIWHIMKIYSYFGINEFIICCGYKGYLIKEYFSNYSLHRSDITIDIFKNTIDVHKKNAENWKITLVDTGQETFTGGRILRIKNYVNENFLLTYGDGVANINVKELINYHKLKNKSATMTVVQPIGRFGSVNVDKDSNLIKNFYEKPKGDGYWINGGFFVLKNDIFKYLKDDSTVWEKEPLENLSKNSELAAYYHKDFWYAMDTMRDKEYLDKLWSSNKAPWKFWDEK